MVTASAPASFDRIARPYRWMEYLTFGPALWHCRTHFLAQLTDRRHALILGDGDGRFTSALLAVNPHVTINAVDFSAAMLSLLAQRAHTTAPKASARLHIYHSDALTFARNLSPDVHYDLVVTHFFLDCLTQSEVVSLAQSIAPHLDPGALWLLSDFRIPTGAMNLPARALVRSLYLAFQTLTGLLTTDLPDHTRALSSANFAPIAQYLSLGGILSTELWSPEPSPTRRTLHTMQLPPQHPRSNPVPDPVPNPEPPSPSLPAPDPSRAPTPGP